MLVIVLQNTKHHAKQVSSDTMRTIRSVPTTDMPNVRRRITKYYIPVCNGVRTIPKVAQVHYTRGNEPSTRRFVRLSLPVSLFLKHSVMLSTLRPST
ncbi:hypothetical protein QBC45DRAFT_90604 [Copromyces sp. CBS 386.78]|nr:hypothetical protein QBC45DRAFT_90604 [Copromyces sp. CBS 386.78]